MGFLDVLPGVFAWSHTIEFNERIRGNELDSKFVILSAIGVGAKFYIGTKTGDVLVITSGIQDSILFVDHWEQILDTFRGDVDPVVVV